LKCHNLVKDIARNFNLKVEFEQVKENLSETHNYLQTCSLELKTNAKDFGKP
jgi:hypothetical protein